MDDTNTPIRRPVWSAWATIGFGLVVALVLTLAQIIVIGVVVAMRYSGGSEVDTESLVESLPKDGGVLAVAVIVGAIVGIVLVLFIIKRRRGPSVSEYLALVPISGRTLAFTIAISVGIIVVSDSLTLLLGKPVVPQYMVDVYETRTWPIMFWLALVIAGPAVEEVFFRGFLFAGLRQSRLGDVGTIVLTSLAWALLHTQYGSYELATIFAEGIVLGIVRIKTGSLWSPLIIHASTNLVGTVEVALYVAGVVG